MSSNSDGDYSEMELCDNGVWKKVRHKRKKTRDRLGSCKRNKEPTSAQIEEIIIGPSSSLMSQKTIETSDNQPKRSFNKNPQTTQQNKNIQHKNFSPLMKEIANKKYKHMFYLSTDAECTRISLCDLWQKLYPQSDDVIIKTKMGFLLKTNHDKDKIVKSLTTLQSVKKITSFKETSPNNKPATSTPAASYSVVIGSVELEIDEKLISNHMNSLKLEHRYCKRIISQATQKPTTLIRIITGSPNTSETLLREGLFYKYRHYPVYPSKPPTPTPKPCSKCLVFTHSTESCNATIKCFKCFGSHSTTKCTSTLPPKCTGCGSEEHQAWAFKCPKRPTAPIAGIPNIHIKLLNKRSQEISSDKKKSRIHNPVTIHDMIINTYINDLNNPKNSNREELIQKLRRRFVDNFNVDTTAVFSGNRVYILIFELDNEDSISATEPVNNTNIQCIQSSSV